MLNIPLHKKIMGSAVIIGILISLSHVFFCIDVYTDLANFYGPVAKAFARGDYPGAYNGIIGPLNPAAASIFIRMGLHEFTALMLVSGFFYVICVFPLFGMLRIILKNRDYAAWGCMMYILTPKIIRFGCSGLLNSGRNFFLVAAAYMVLSFFEKKRPWKLPGLGLCLAGLALNRGEGLLYAPLFAAWLLLIPWQNSKWKLSRSICLTAVKRIAVVAAVTILLLLPRMARLYRETGIPSTDSRQSEAVKHALARLGIVVKVQPKPVAEPQVLSPELRAALKNPESTPQPSAQKSEVKRLLKKAGKFIDCFGRGAYWVYLAFAALGLVIIIRRREFNFELWLPVSIVIYSAFIFAQVVLAYRYFTINAIMLLPFSFTGLRFVFEQAGRFRLRPVAVTALIIMGILQAENSMEKVLNRKYDYEKGIGRWLAENRAKLDVSGQLRILSPKPQYGFWGRIDFICQKEALYYADKSFLAQKGINVVVVKSKNSDVIRSVTESKLYIERRQPYNQVKVFTVISASSGMRKGGDK